MDKTPSGSPRETRFRKTALLVIGAIVLYQLLDHWNDALGAVRWVLRVLSPIVTGLCIAFIVNLPMRLFEKLFTTKRKRVWLERAKRPISLFLSYVVILAFIAGLFIMLIPPLIDSVVMLAENIEVYYSSFEAAFIDMWERFHLSPEIMQRFQAIGESAIGFVDELLSQFVPWILKFTMSLPSGIMMAFLSIILSIYVLAQKEELAKQSKDLIRAMFPRKSKRVLEIAAMTNRAFNRFIIGQMTEALILGSLLFLGMQILEIPYAILVSVVVGVTSLIPVLGAYIGTVASAFLIVMIDPFKALFFLLLVILLQQIENNVIYPRVVGNSIGLKGMWVLVAVVVGGGLFGIPGILFGVPTMSVVYRLIADWTKKRKKMNQGR